MSSVRDPYVPPGHYYSPMPSFTDQGSPELRYRFQKPSYSYADGTFLHTFRVHMPLCLKNPGGALWMERVG